MGCAQLRYLTSSVVAFVLMSDRRILNYAIQGTSSSSTWRARIYPFLSVLTSASIFSFACHELFIAELPPLNLNKLKVVDIVLALFSDSSAILDLLNTHCYIVPYGPAPFLTETFNNPASIDDVFENFASLTHLSAVLQLDRAICVGIYGLIPPSSATISLTSSVFLSQSQLSKTFCIIFCFGCRILAHRQKTLAVATPNHDSSSLWILLRMGLIQVLAIMPSKTLCGRYYTFLLAKTNKKEIYLSI